MPLINIVNSLGSKTIHSYNGTPHLTRTSPLRKHHPFAGDVGSRKKNPQGIHGELQRPTLAVMPFHLGCFLGIGSWKKKTWGGTVGVFTMSWPNVFTYHLMWCLWWCFLHWRSMVVYQSIFFKGQPTWAYQFTNEDHLPIESYRLQPTDHALFVPWRPVSAFFLQFFTELTDFFKVTLMEIAS